MRKLLALLAGLFASKPPRPTIEVLPPPPPKQIVLGVESEYLCPCCGQALIFDCIVYIVSAVEDKGTYPNTYPVKLTEDDGTQQPAVLVCHRAACRKEKNPAILAFGKK